MDKVFHRVRAFLVALLTGPVRLYQRHISPGLQPRCRYYPSCSEYTVQALHSHGPAKGLALGSWRILRCNPWSKGGVDHIPEKGRWKAPEWVPPDDWAGHDIEEGAGSVFSRFFNERAPGANGSAADAPSHEAVDKKES